jgi:hypothetical protein
MSPKHHVVVDGSNLATEGRTLPSLAQLDEAVRSYLEEDPDAEIVVVVDASFEHRISPEERQQLEQAELHGEVVSPPAGAIGRGDAFVLRIAERTGATVVSNDSFQEFHGEHPWLFDDGRLIGGKPVPGVGWIFTPRIPVRGAKSRKAMGAVAKDEHEAANAAAVKAAEVAKAAKRAARRVSGTATKKATPRAPAGDAKEKKPKKSSANETPDPTSGGRASGAGKVTPARAPAKKAVAAKKAAKKTASPKTAAIKAPAKAVKPDKKVRAKKAAPASTDEAGTEKATTKKAADRRRPADRRVQKAIVDATVEALVAAAPKPKVTKAKTGDEKGGERGSKRRRRGVLPPPAVNEPLAFITFVATYPIGGVVEGEVASYTSHGAMVEVGLPGGGVLHCYVPLAGLGDPPPIRAREVLSRGDRRQFVLIGLDPQRRMAELALPGVVEVGAH